MKSELVWLILCTIIIIIDFIIIQKDLDSYIETKDKWHVKNLKELIVSIILASIVIGINLHSLLG